MGAHGYDGAILNVRMRAFIFCGVLLINLAISSKTSAVSIEPVITTVTSITQVEKSKAAETKSDQKTVRNTNTSNLTQLPATTSTNEDDPIGQPPITSEPLAELPVVDTPQLSPVFTPVTRPVNAIAASHSTVGRVASNVSPVGAPLQATHQGWKIFGVFWYWWMLVAVTAYVAGRVALARYRRQNLVEAPVSV